MRFKFLIAAIILFSVVFSSKAQDFRLGKVSIEELNEKVHPKDSSAVAAVLFEKAENRLIYNQGSGFEIELVVKARIKIYKKEGYKWANKAFRYYLVNNMREKISFSEAVTYNLVDGKIEKTKLKNDGEFDEVINKYWGQKKITMPNVKEGSIIEYEYSLHSPNIGNPRDWYFQSDIPVNRSEYINYVPEYFVFNTNVKGFIRPEITVAKSNKMLTINSKERVVSRMGAATTNFNSDNINYIETRTTYLAENMPAIKEEAFVNNVRNYTTSLEQELSMTKFPNAMPKMYSTDWDAVVKTIYEYDDFGPELNKTGYFEDDLKAVIAGLNTQDEKINAILKFVKSTVKWNDYYGYSCNDGVRKAYKDKTGNIAEINLMLTAMLRYAGLNANPVLVSTRSNGISFFPNRTAFNYVIAAIENGNDVILLDASDPFSTPDVLPFRTLNWLGRLIRKDGTSMPVDLMPKKASVELKTMLYSVNDKGEVLGKLRNQKTAHNAMLFRGEIKDIKEDAYLEKLENTNSKIEIKEYSLQNEKDFNLPVIESYSFVGNNLSELIGGKIYINPMLFFARKQNPFKQENREYPVDYGFPFQDKYAINIQIPEGFKVENLPQSITLTMNGDLGVFKYLANLQGNTIQISVSNQINSSIVLSQDYVALKSYYQKMIEKQNEKIVIVKI
ncbi:DUF3857 domain-containing protein [Flavobacterium sufflavum]|uniref:DUF3857 domain-containing protein n=1 Tax=Flavobacterium sufflavum TaxID=1921138 RepID=A0A437KNS3_9FLAO|nr:DUF3857 domain-containing protein [Flavobacterium sufflavum]RVT73159.1 DUF3857 domain-containing protein [Flavobacterium sufflavum]